MNLSEILKKYIDRGTMDEMSENIWPDMLEAMKAAIDADRKSRWISVEDRLPKPDKKVILLQNVSDTRKAQIFGFYAPKNTIEYEGSDQYGFQSDYSEEDDMFYIPEGFYELVENWDDLAFIQLSPNSITHWQPLPDKPEELR